MQRGSLEEIRQCNTGRFKSDAPFVSRLITRLPPRLPPPWSIGLSRAPSRPTCRSRNRRTICLWST